MSVKLKICGLMRSDDVQMCMRYGVDILGFVVDYPHPVPWNISAQKAKELVSKAFTKTCIVTGGDAQKVLETALTVLPDYVQLHTRETVEDTSFLVNALREYNIEVIKSIYPDTEDLEVSELSSTGVYALLFDSRVPENAQTSSKADLSRFIKLKELAKCPLILAGGLDAENIVSAIQTAKPWMVDIMTGIETSPGVKEEGKLRTLIEAVR